MRFETAKNLYTGREYERDLAGEINRQHPDYEKELKQTQWATMKTGWRPTCPEALPFKEAAEFTEKFQSGDPTNPRQDFARELRLALAEKLGLEEETETDKLKFFTAIGGPLDMHHVDFFFSWQPETNGPKHRATFDITKNPDKEETLGKTDILIGGDIPDPSDDNFNEKEYLKTIDFYAQLAAETLKRRLNQEQLKIRRQPKNRQMPEAQTSV